MPLDGAEGTFATVTEWLLMVCIGVVVLGALVMMIRHVSQRGVTGGPSPSVGSVILVVGIIAVLLLPVALASTGLNSETSDSASTEAPHSESSESADAVEADPPPEQAQREPAEPASEPESSNPDDGTDGSGSLGDLPWGWLLFGAVVLIVAVIGAFVGYHAWAMTRRAATRHRAEREARDRLRATYAAQWADLRERGEAAVEGWLAYETDLALLLRYPVMGDLTDPVTQRVVRAVASVRSLTAESAADPDAPVVDGPFGKAVQELEAAFTAAKRHAVKVRDSRFSPTEQKQLRTAQHLLARALDVTNHPQERHLAYERVIKLLDGLLPVPEKAKAELAERAGVTPALEQGAGRVAG